MQELLDEEASEDGETSPSYPQMASTPWPGNTGPLFNYMPYEHNVSMHHPTKDQMLKLWSVYEQHVSPVVRIFHLPTTKVLFQMASTGAESITSTTEPALFSIYYAAIVSLSEEQCQELLRESRTRLLKKYRWGLEQALSRADFLNSSSMIVLQAFALFAICVRRHDETRMIVTWSAIAGRIAMSLGLHRDGSRFGLDPFETEIRRRVWWHLVLLDSDSSRDHGMDPMISTASFDTNVPLNIEDDDILPNMPTPPIERSGFTVMTNSITRFETSIMAQRLALGSPQLSYRKSGKSLRTLEDKENAVRELQAHLDERYLQYCDYNIPLQRATAVYVRSSCAMLWMTIYHPEQRKSNTISQDMRDQLFSSMAEVIENTRLLECNKTTSQWGWYFHNDVQWPAIAYILNELLVRPPGPSVSRAWKVIDAARRQWDADSTPIQKGMLWRAVKTMTAKAGLSKAEQSLPNGGIPHSHSSIPRAHAGQSATSKSKDDIFSLQTMQPPGQSAYPPMMQVPDELDALDPNLGEDSWFRLEDDFLTSDCNFVATGEDSFLQEHSMPKHDNWKGGTIGRNGDFIDLTTPSTLTTMFGDPRWSA